MATPARYAIVGSGNIGSALARLFARAGIAVTIANTRGPESMSTLTAGLGSGVRAVPVEQALESDVVFLAIPFGAVEHFGTSLDNWTGKTVIDTTNAHRTPNAAEILQGQPSAQYAAAHLPGAHVVKAFNHLPANTLESDVDPQIGRRVIFIATDFPEAGDQVADLVQKLGFAAVQLGRIDEGGLLVQAPNALVMRNLIEQPLV